MKQLFLSLLLAVCTVCNAQTNHMKFKGIPIEGTLNSFVQKLKDKGYTFIGQQDGMAILKGEFAATKGCTIGVARFSDRDQVNLVAVIFPEEETWSGITKSYYTLKDMLTEKYGSPECVEQFSDREPSSDFLKFHAILNDECHYVSEFSCENGKIQLTMSKQDYNSAAVPVSAHPDPLLCGVLCQPDLRRRPAGRGRQPCPHVHHAWLLRGVPPVLSVPGVQLHQQHRHPAGHGLPRRMDFVQRADADLLP